MNLNSNQSFSSRMCRRFQASGFRLLHHRTCYNKRDQGNKRQSQSYHQTSPNPLNLDHIEVMAILWRTTDDIWTIPHIPVKLLWLALLEQKDQYQLVVRSKFDMTKVLWTLQDFLSFKVVLQEAITVGQHLTKIHQQDLAKSVTATGPWNMREINMPTGKMGLTSWWKKRTNELILYIEYSICLYVNIYNMMNSRKYIYDYLW